MPRHVQYIHPRCPKCKKHAWHSKRPDLGYNLRFEPADNGKARVTCLDCRYSWLSKNLIAIERATPVDWRANKTSNTNEE